MRTLLPKCSVAAALASILILSACAGMTKAQVPQVRIQLLSSDSLEMPANAVKRFLVRRNGQILSAHYLRSDGRVLVSVPDRPVVQLPRRLAAVISEDGSTILQFGDETDRMHPRRTNLYWISQEGEVTAQIENRYGGETRITLSPDGFAAIAGPLYDEPGRTEIALYDPSGSQVWDARLREDERIDNIRAAPQGAHVAALVTNREDWLRDNRIQLRRDGGSISGEIRDFGILQKLTILGDGSKILVQGYNTYGMVDIPSGTIIWKRHGKIRMVSPFGATLSPAGDVLFLTLADLQTETQGAYRWILLALAASTGQELMREALPGEHPTSRHRTFERVSATEMRVLAGGRRFNYSWDKR